MAIFRLDTKLDEKTIYDMVHYIHKCGVFIPFVLSEEIYQILCILLM